MMRDRFVLPLLYPLVYPVVAIRPRRASWRTLSCQLADGSRVAAMGRALTCAVGLIDFNFN
eukprot:3212720-Pyramimonas_sp.AAC.3